MASQVLSAVKGGAAGSMPIRRALVSVFDKTGVVDFVGALAERGVSVVSTGGTASQLRQAGISVSKFRHRPRQAAPETVQWTELCR